MPDIACRQDSVVATRGLSHYTKRMLYFTCRQGHYYAGQLGAPSRHDTRPARTDVEALPEIVARIGRTVDAELRPTISERQSDGGLP